MAGLPLQGPKVGPFGAALKGDRGRSGHRPARGHDPLRHPPTERGADPQGTGGRGTDHAASGMGHPSGAGSMVGSREGIVWGT